LNGRLILAGKNAQIAEVERRRPDADQDFTSTGLWNLVLFDDQAVGSAKTVDGPKLLMWNERMDLAPGRDAL